MRPAVERGKCRKIFIRYAHMFAGSSRMTMMMTEGIYVPTTSRVHEKVGRRSRRGKKELEEEIRYIHGDDGSAGKM